MQGKTVYIKTSLKEILEEIKREGIDATSYYSGLHCMQTRINYFLALLNRGKIIVRK